MEFFFTILWQGRGEKGCLGLCVGCGWQHKKGLWFRIEGFRFFLGLRV
jgi:hypothetical protein